MSAWRRLTRGCWFGCDPIRERDADGVLLLRCERCGSQHTPDLSRDTYRGSAHQQAEILGQPNTKVRRHLARPGKVSRFTRS